MIKVSPSRTKSSAASSWPRCATDVAPRCSERRVLRLQARHLFNRRCPRIADKHLIILRYYSRTMPPDHP